MKYLAAAQVKQPLPPRGAQGARPPRWHSPSCGAHMGPRGHAMNWIREPAQMKNNLPKEKGYFQPNQFPSQAYSHNHSNGCPGAGKVHAWKPAAGVRRRAGAATEKKKKCINLNAWLGLWENTNPPSQPSNKFSLKREQSKESRISNAISSPLNGSITSK